MDAAKHKPPLTFWQIWNMCFGFLGIQMGFALQNANVSRIFQTLGAEIDAIPILWIAAPVTGLVVQPIIGYMSDRTWNRFGRRRPYFLVGALLASAALLYMPHSPVLWVAAGMLWIMDASINISMEPFRALVGDMLPPQQRTSGFAMQSFFIGVGAVVASALPWIMSNWLDIANTAPPGVVPDSVKWSFTIGGLALFLAVGWTILRTREYPPEELAAHARAEGGSAPETAIATGLSFLGSGLAWSAAGLALLLLLTFRDLDKQLYVLGMGLLIFGLMEVACERLQRTGRVNNGFFEVIALLKSMPRTMKQLAVVQFFSWFALFAMWIYTTPAVTLYHFGSSDPASQAYNDGADWVGVLFASYNGFAALAALVIPAMAARLGLRWTHLVNLCLGGLGLASMLLIRDPQWLLLSMLGVGMAWASIVSVPYALLSGALPAARMGVYMGIFNFFIVIPQLLAASVLGFLLRTAFQGEAINALLMGGMLMILAGLATLFVTTDR
jgi:maltose/moltooligosaccharide transporter